MAENTPAASHQPAKAAAKAPEMQLSSDPNKDPSKPSKFDHGETPQYLKDQQKAREAAAKDPWGLTPDQHRGEPAKTEGTAFAVDGLNPHTDLNEHIVGGTLPPV